MLNKLVAQNASGTVQDCCCQYTSILQLVSVEVGRKKSSRMGKKIAEYFDQWCQCRLDFKQEWHKKKQGILISLEHAQSGMDKVLF